MSSPERSHGPWRVSKLIYFINKTEASFFKGPDGKRGVINVSKPRTITPIEAERLQGLPDNYTEGVSNTQRYKMLGNGFTIPVISHLIQNIIT